MSVKYFWHTTVALALGCSSTPVDVGSFAPDNQERFSWIEEVACAAGPQLPIVGTWVGYTDLAPSAARSTEVRLVIAHANGKRICGTITFGREAPPWPPISDSNAAYPPDLVNKPFMSFGNYLDTLEGVPQTITNSRVGLPRVTFEAAYAQWREWCSLQTPYPCEGTGHESQYFCIPASGSGTITPRITHKDGVCITTHGGEQEVVDCGKVALCIDGPCSCTAAKCAGPPKWTTPYDLVFGGDSVEGSGLHLTRVR